MANKDVPAKSTVINTPSTRFPTLPVTSRPVKPTTSAGSIAPTEPVANKLANQTCR